MFPDELYQVAIETLRPVLEGYRENYRFTRNSVYYDAKANPVEHMNAFYELACVYEELNVRVFNCFPLRRSWIPSYVTIDSKILCQNIMGLGWENGQDKMDLWGQAVNLNSRVFRDQENHVLKFTGTIQTDGFGVTVLKKRNDNKERYTTRYQVESERTRYVHEVDHQELQQYTGRCVTVDPGRRDLLFCVHETSTPDNPRKFRFTKSQQNQFEKIHKYKRIREETKPFEVYEAERTLDGYNSLELAVFNLYLVNRFRATNILQDHYVTVAARDNPGNPLHRKLKFSSYMRRQKGNEKLIKELKDKFNNDAVFIMGNWSSPNTVFHEPTRGIGFRRLLKKNNFTVMLIDEFRTSKCCPECHHLSLETFRRAPNPRPHRRRTQPRVTRHGLLR